MMPGMRGRYWAVLEAGGWTCACVAATSQHPRRPRFAFPPAGSNYTMHTLSTADWVSLHINNNGIWNEEETRKLLERLKAYAQVRCDHVSWGQGETECNAAH